ncbi:hypothetical protein BpHYR1_022361 [Brachionus plicatilis]|uniref:Uncharacterized protein n=1 Tax=Brachionus plicatilis TaxID=10195 RepID=A0A3M7P658_BRAPC|nr:hypothetical protein BpHYR1_022361 [Brachionus plicatilis]
MYKKFKKDRLVDLISGFLVFQENKDQFLLIVIDIVLDKYGGKSDCYKIKVRFGYHGEATDKLYKKLMKP